ncbi:MAG: DUF2796 domain-containing protein [Pseudomonadota bacterium]
MNARFSPYLLASSLALPGIATAGEHHHDHHAHVHGMAKLEVAVESGRIDLHLESPLEALLGFEHAPRTAQEKSAVAKMAQTLRQADKLFVPTAAAGCKLASVELESPVLEKESPHAKDHKHAAHPESGEAHGDLDGNFVFTCAQPGKLTGMEVRLPGAFPRMQRIDAQVVSAKGQSARKLTAKMRFLSW